MKTRSESGSVLIVALGLALLMAISAAGYLYLATGVYKRTARSFYYNSTLNTAEAGVEQALWAINKTDWTGWTTVGSDRKLTGSTFSDANGMKAYYNVYVKDATSQTPTITAEGVAKMPNGAPVKKQLRIYTTIISLYIPGFTAINDLTLGGKYFSYPMSRGPNTATWPSGATYGYNMSIGSKSIQIGDAIINSNATVYGKISTGVPATDSTAFINSIRGQVLAPDTLTNTSKTGVYSGSGNNKIDSAQIAYDFQQSYKDPGGPTGYTSVSTTLGAQDNLGNYILGVKGAATPTLYQISGDVTATGIVVVGPVQLQVSGNVKLTGDSAVLVTTTSTTLTSGNGANTQTHTYDGASTAKLEVYVSGNVDIAGNATVSTQDPKLITIYGMATTNEGQTFALGGNGSMSAIIYAPHANINFNGSGTAGYFAGALVGYNVKVNGSKYNIEYPDEFKDASLGTITGVAKWVELTNKSDWYSF